MLRISTQFYSIFLELRAIENIFCNSFDLKIYFLYFHLVCLPSVHFFLYLRDNIFIAINKLYQPFIKKYHIIQLESINDQRALDNL